MKDFFEKYRYHLLATLGLATPIFAGQLGQVLMGVADTAMVGRVSKEALAAAGASNAVFFVITVFGIGLSTAVSPLAATALAKKDKASLKGILVAALIASVLISIILQLVLILATSKFELLKQAPEVGALAVSYLKIVSFSIMPLVVFLCAKQFSDGLGQTLVPMLITLVAVPLNVFLNWLFIFGNWGFEAMGLDGAGYATLLTRVLMMLSLLIYLVKGPKISGFIQGQAKGINIQFWRTLKLGIPSGFQYFFEIAAFGGAAIMAGWIGTTEQAAHNIAINLASLTYMGATGISAAGGIRVGTAAGRKNKIRLQRAGFSAIGLGIIWMSLSALLFVLFRYQLAALYTNNQEVFIISVKLLAIAAIFQLSDGIQCIALGILRGLQDVQTPMLITFFAYWVIGLPLGYLLGFKTSMGVEGIWVALLMALTASAILLTARFYYLSKRF